MIQRSGVAGILSWVDGPAILTAGNVGLNTFRQHLTEDDVTHILNGANAISFDFSKLKIRAANCDGAVSPQLIDSHHLNLTNKSLLTKYPKLEINILQAVYSFVY